MWIKFKKGELEVASPDPQTIFKDVVYVEFETNVMMYSKGLTYIEFCGECLPEILLKYKAEREKEKKPKNCFSMQIIWESNVLLCMFQNTRHKERETRDCPYQNRVLGLLL